MGCGGLAVLTILGIIGFFVWLGFQPEGGVRMANQMEEYAIAYLEANPILEEGENLIAYYDITMSLDGSDAILLTDRRLIHHKADRDDVAVDLAQVEDFTHTEDPIMGDVFQVNAEDGRILKFEIALFNDGDSFKMALDRQLERVQEGAGSPEEAREETAPAP